MNIVEIPIASSASHFVQENSVFGNTFFLEFEWIEKVGFWILHMADGHEKPLAAGIRLNSDWPLYTHYEASTPITFALLSQRRGYELDRKSLNRDFTLVAYESL